MSNGNRLQPSKQNVTHTDLVNLVRIFSDYKIPEGGVCNGVTSMWIQAVLTGKAQEENFYKRLDFLSKYLSKANNSLKTLKEEIDEIYKSQIAQEGRERATLSSEQLNLLDIRAFAESIALQQKPSILGSFKQYIHQTVKDILFPLTASATLDRSADLTLLPDAFDEKKLGEKIYIEQNGNRLKYLLLNVQGKKVEGFLDLPLSSTLTEKSLRELTPAILDELAEKEHIKKIKTDVVGTVSLSEQPLVEYLDAMQKMILKDHKDKKSNRGKKFLTKMGEKFSRKQKKKEPKDTFLLASDNHAVGMYFDIPSKKWHFFDVNKLTGEKTFFVAETSKNLAATLFKSFSDNNQGNTIFSIRYISATPNKELVHSLQNITSSMTVPEIKNARGVDAFYVAVCTGDVKSVEILLEKGADINATYKDDRTTALMQATGANHLEIVNLLLVAPKIDVNAQDKDGVTALIMAATIGNIEVLNRLLDPKIKINVEAQDNEGRTALMYAAQQGHVEIVKALLNVTIDADIEDNNQQTALMLAAERGHLEMVNLLLDPKNKININVQNKNKETALMLALQNGHLEIVQALLVTPGINVNAQNKNGETAMMLAATMGRKEIVEALLNTPGIDINIVDKNGKTAEVNANEAAELRSITSIASAPNPYAEIVLLIKRSRAKAEAEATRIEKARAAGETARLTVAGKKKTPPPPPERKKAPPPPPRKKTPPPPPPNKPF